MGNPQKTQFKMHFEFPKAGRIFFCKIMTGKKYFSANDSLKFFCKKMHLKPFNYVNSITSNFSNHFLRWLFFLFFITLCSVIKKRKYNGRISIMKYYMETALLHIMVSNLFKQCLFCCNKFISFKYSVHWI